MPNYFLTKVNFLRINEETGKQEKVSQQNLIDAETFTEAESCLYKEFEKDFMVDAISRYRVSEVIDGAGDWYFRVKCIFIIYDEEKGKEKRVKVPYLIKSGSVKQAEASFNEFMKGTMSDYEIAGIESTQVDDVLKYEQKHPQLTPKETETWNDDDSEIDLPGGQSEINS